MKTIAPSSILIVEKSSELRDTLTGLLEGEGYQVSAVSTGTEAIVELRKGILPSLILIDIVMPSLDGWALIDEIQFNTGLRSVPVYTNADIINSARSFKVTGVVKKVDVEEVMAIVRKHCAHKT